MAVTLDIPQNGIYDLIHNKFGTYKGNLNHYYKILEKLPNNSLLLYHNPNHHYHVMWVAHLLALYYRHLRGERMLVILLASMFHDAGYKIGASESENIEMAIKIMESSLLPKHKKLALEIAKIIRFTEFPHKMSIDEMPLPAKIVCEADLSPVLTTNGLNKVISALAIEKGVPPKDILSSEESFITKFLEYDSIGAKTIFPPLIEKVIRETRAMLNLGRINYA